MSDYIRAQCDSCQADIIWTVTASSGARMPVDYEPTPKGNIALRPGPGAPIATVLSVAKQFGRKELRTSHFATCPDAARHRKRGRS